MAGTQSKAILNFSNLGAGEDGDLLILVGLGAELEALQAIRVVMPCPELAMVRPSRMAHSETANKIWDKIKRNQGKNFGGPHA